MSEGDRGAAASWRRSYIVVAAAAIIAPVIVALAGSWALVIAAAIALLLTGLFVHLASAWQREARRAITKVPSSEIAALEPSARAILECLDDPLLVLETSGRILFANRSSHPLVGAEAERKHISAVLRTPEVLEAVSRVLLGGAAESVAFTFLVPVQRHYRAYLARSEGSPSLGSLVLIQFHDLTAVRRAEELRADFVANASHELRTPLAAVVGFIDTLRGHAKNDSEARERFLEIMSVETSRMRRLIDDLLSLTRIELNEHNPPAGEVDVVTLVRDASAALAPLAEADTVRIRVQDHEPLPVTGDRDELMQVFQNLLHNAIKYGRAAGEVRVNFGRSGSQGKREAAGQVFVAVEDEGEGIPRDVIPRLTERFYRVDIKRSRERGGTGLGLAIVKHILNRHHGRLQVESVLGQGSTFTVFLPAAPQPAPR
jgi:two-component system phosphate regulon sensor histidine kinase PhoR